MSKKNVWIIVISVIVVMALTAVLLSFMIGDAPKAGDGGATTPQNQESTPDSEPATQPSGTTEPATTEPATTEPATTEPATTEPATTEPATTEPATTIPPTTEPPTTTPIDIDVDPDDGEEEESDDGVIDFDDLIAAMG